MSGETRINRKYKDTLFRFIFGSEDRRENALALYNVLNETDYANPEDLELVTIDDIIYMNMKNDVAVMLNGAINLYEQQSSWNPNMPLRGLFYLSGIYNEYVSTHNLNIYSRSTLRLPTPRYFVLYNGTERNFDRTVLRLEDSFDDSERSCIRLSAKVININVDINKELLDHCRPLYEYSVFVQRVRELTASGMTIEDAVQNTVDYCIANNILRDILVKHKAEVIGMCITEYDEQKTMQLFKDEIEREKARADREEARADQAEALVEKLRAELRQLKK